ncbi:MAG: type I restriction endonuclease subunit R [Bacilli bacterium]|nr:type I restriction endonuclease subunit R [Bacilli bacterium]
MAEKLFYKVISETENIDAIVSKHDFIQTNYYLFRSEKALEEKFIKLLQEEEYEYKKIHSENELILNLRGQLSKLNNYNFTDDEWNRFLNNYISKDRDSYQEKTEKIQKNYYYELLLDDGTKLNVKIIDKKDILNNHLQVINQYQIDDSSRSDVIILINGIPMVCIELKKPGINIENAFNQINNYKKYNFCSNNGLFAFIQLFIITNGNETKYYANTTRNNTIDNSDVLKTSGTNNSFEFTFFWADSKNNAIKDLVNFSKTFLRKKVLLEIITKYCCFTSNKELLVMRPYQIFAAEKVLEKVFAVNNGEYFGKYNARGYIWHATGSGKTLTSFKIAQLIMQLPYIEKVLFVVDRKDLDDQTVKEYERFEKGSAEGNSSVKKLAEQLKSDSSKIIITTIQKLSDFISKDDDQQVYNKKTVIIFDECHRSQFGEMRNKITKSFKKNCLFGFTGTPIFEKNANNKYGQTTKELFFEELHRYTIDDAIKNGNVLPFKFSYVNTFEKINNNISNEKATSLDKQTIYENPKRISCVVDYILKNFDSQTYRNNHSVVLKIQDSQNSKIIEGFNSILATQSINSARKYYEEFKKQNKNLEQKKQIKIAIIYSYENQKGDEDYNDISGLLENDRDFLSRAISDYNSTFSENFSISNIRNYYRSISKKMKNKEIDLLIVVNMFLTGFDAPCLNTLWLDKDLENHSLLQACSRTNRILNKKKQFGNIVCFRDLRDAEHEAWLLFGGNGAENSFSLIKSFNAYYKDGYKDEKNQYHDGYINIVKKMTENFPIINYNVSITKGKEREFILLFNEFLRAKHMLSSFPEFSKDKEIISDDDFNAYSCGYQNVYEQQRTIFELNNENSIKINDEIVYEAELVEQHTVGVEFIEEIFKRFEKYKREKFYENKEDAKITSAAKASPILRSKWELLEEFFLKNKMNKNLDNDSRNIFFNFIDEKRKNDFYQLIEKEKFRKEETRKYINMRLQNKISRNESLVYNLMQPISRLNKGRMEEINNKSVALEGFIEKYYGFDLDDLG